MNVRAFAAKSPKSKLEEVSITLPNKTETTLDIDVDYCGICHSDLSMIDNEWQFSNYPLVAGHEIVGRVTAVGAAVSDRFKKGDRVGVGWFSKSCRCCTSCRAGYDNMCVSGEQTIIGRPGGFADQVRVDASWAIPLPDTLKPETAGPLFCGGITVFGPLVEYGIRPTDRVGVVGIGGLGHMAVKFLKSWGCEVTAFTSRESKINEARAMGAHHVLLSNDTKAFEKIQGSLDFVLVTVNAPLDWNAYLSVLSSRGRLHFVGAVLEPLNIGVFSMLGGQKSVSASPLGKPEAVTKMLDFAARHNIAPTTEFFPMKDINAAIEHLRAGKARYRIVLDNTR
jgi:uncharacterized zinc-type alcohol dehydrogenase-like protein